MTKARNEYRIVRGYAYITLTHGQKTRIDVEDLERVLPYRWRATYSPSQDSYYANTSIPVEGGSKSLTLSRLIMNAPSDKVVDHWNGDTLDNTKENLRIVSTQQNNQNKQRAYRNNKTGIRGVTINQDNTGYIVVVGKDGKTHYGGTFPLTEEGLIAAEEKAIEIRKSLGFHSRI